MNTSASRGSASGAPRTRSSTSAGGDEQQENGRRRLDYQLAEDARDGQGLRGRRDFRSPSATTHPTSTAATQEYNDEILGQLTQVLSNRMLNEVKAGRPRSGSPRRVSLTGRIIGSARTASRTGRRASCLPASVQPQPEHPRTLDQDIYSVRDDFTYSFKGDVTTCGPAASYCYVTSL